jgi:hypothetical protein
MKDVIKSFNVALQWAAENGVSLLDIITLKRFKAFKTNKLK